MCDFFIAEMLYIYIALFFVPIILYLYNKHHYTKWKKLGVPGPEPTFFFGNMKDVAFLRNSLSDTYHQIYNKFSNCKYVGIFILNRPAIIAQDPTIIESVLVKNFSSFHDNDLEIRNKEDPIFGNNPFTLKGEAWKVKRIQHLSSLTPARIKIMFPEIDESGNRMVLYLNRQIDKNGGKFCMTCLELAARFTTESVTACGLGINSNSFTDGKAELREAGKDIFEPSFSRSIRLLLVFLIPNLAHLLTIRMIPDSLARRYRNLVIETKRYREENNIKRNDFFDHIQEFKGEKNSIDEMTAQLGGLYIDGFGTNSSGLNFMIYNIAAHEQVQKRLRNEIREYMEKNDGVITLEALLEMPYLDAVVSESLRRFPPFPVITKCCTKSFTLPRATEDSSELLVETGTPVVVPIYSVHNDPKNFADPDKFDPERFLNGNKESIVKYSYLPFGDGPRICLGMRFGLAQSKVALVKLIQNFNLTVDYTKTKIPIEFDPYGLMLAVKGGLWVNFEKL